MNGSPSDPRRRPAYNHPTWRGIIASAILIAAPLFTFWTVTHPLAGAALLVAGTGAFVAMRRAALLARCLSECGSFAVDFGSSLRITVTHPPTDDATTHG